MVFSITAKTQTVKVSLCSNGILYPKTIITYSKEIFRMETPLSTTIMMRMVLIVIQIRSRFTNSTIARFLNQEITLVVTIILMSCITVVQMVIFIVLKIQQSLGKQKNLQRITIKRQSQTNAKVI